MAGNHQFSISKNFSYVGADTVDGLYEALEKFNNHPHLEAEIAAFAARTSTGATERAVNAVKQEMPGSTTASAPASTGEVEVLTNQKGTRFTYGHPDAPDLARGGKFILMEGKGAKGDYKAWVDPSKGPKPVSPPDTPEDTRWIR